MLVFRSLSLNLTNQIMTSSFSGFYKIAFDFGAKFQEFSNIPLEHTPDPQPTVYVSEFFSFGGENGCLGYAPGVCWGFSWSFEGRELAGRIKIIQRSWRLAQRMMEADESLGWDPKRMLCGINLLWWWFQIFFIFTPIWGNDPIWLIFFKWVETTN